MRKGCAAAGYAQPSAATRQRAKNAFMGKGFRVKSYGVGPLMSSGPPPLAVGTVEAVCRTGTRVRCCFAPLLVLTLAPTEDERGRWWVWWVLKQRVGRSEEHT